MASFDRSVFVNCPFDAEYEELLRPLLFTLLALDFQPRIASERLDSGETRLSKITELIQSSRYSIHDLSRLKASEVGELYRLNMPFELGIDFGARLVGGPPFDSKLFLVLGTQPYDFQKALSDIAGMDIKSHADEPEDIVRAVRNWFVETVGLYGTASASTLWSDFIDFTLDFHDERAAEGFSEEDLTTMPVPEYIDFVRGWLSEKESSA